MRRDRPAPPVEVVAGGATGTRWERTDLDLAALDGREEAWVTRRRHAHHRRFAGLPWWT